MANTAQAGSIKNRENYKLFSIIKLNPLGGNQKAWPLHCITLLNKLSTDHMFISEKERKSILKTTSKLVTANKKSPQSIDTFLDYLKTSYTLIILKVTQA